MIQECLVTLNNELVTVVLYGDKYIQLPAINREATKVKVCCENGKYFIVDDDFTFEETPPKAKKKGAVKKDSIEIEEISDVETSTEINCKNFDD